MSTIFIPLKKYPSAFEKNGRYFALRNVQLRWNVQLGGNVFSVLFALAYTLAKQIFDLTVYRAEIVLSPSGNGVIQLRREPQGDLFFMCIVHSHRPLSLV